MSMVAETDKIVKPTRIIQKPERVRVTGVQGVGRRMVILCDDGKEYSSNELALIVGFKSVHGFLQRLQKYGWDSPDVLQPPTKTGFKVYRGSPAEEAYARLGYRARNENLKKLKIGSWEARQR